MARASSLLAMAVVATCLFVLVVSESPLRRFRSGVGGNKATSGSALQPPLLREFNGGERDAERKDEPNREQRSLVSTSASVDAEAAPPVWAAPWLAPALDLLRNEQIANTAVPLRPTPVVRANHHATPGWHTQTLSGFVYTTDTYDRVRSVIGLALPGRDDEQITSVDRYVDTVWRADFKADLVPPLEAQWTSGHIIAKSLGDDDMNRHSINFFPQTAACNGRESSYNTQEAAAASLFRMLGAGYVQLEINFVYAPSASAIAGFFYTPVSGAYIVRVLPNCPHLAGTNLAAYLAIAPLPVNAHPLTKVDALAWANNANLVAGANNAYTLSVPFFNGKHVTGVTLRKATSAVAVTAPHVAGWAPPFAPDNRGTRIATVEAAMTHVTFSFAFAGTVVRLMEPSGASQAPANGVQTTRIALTGEAFSGMEFRVKSNRDQTYTFNVRRLPVLASFTIRCSTAAAPPVVTAYPAIALVQPQRDYELAVAANHATCTAATTIGGASTVIYTSPAGAVSGPLGNNAASPSFAIADGVSVIMVTSAHDGAFNLRIRRRVVNGLAINCITAAVVGVVAVPQLLPLVFVRDTLAYDTGAPLNVVSCTVTPTIINGHMVTSSINGGVPSVAHGTGVATAVALPLVWGRNDIVVSSVEDGDYRLAVNRRPLYGLALRCRRLNNPNWVTVAVPFNAHVLAYGPFGINAAVRECRVQLSLAGGATAMLRRNQQPFSAPVAHAAWTSIMWPQHTQAIPISIRVLTDTYIIQLTQ